MTELEISLVEQGVMDSKEIRELRLRDYTEECGGEAELNRRFGPGSFGAHEAGDRASLFLNSWTEYVAEHETITMNPELHRLAFIAGAFMHAVYTRAMDPPKTSRKDSQ